MRSTINVTFLQAITIVACAQLSLVADATGCRRRQTVDWGGTDANHRRIIIAGALGLSVSTLAQQLPTRIACLRGPGESGDQWDRRVAAIMTTRRVNTAEVNGPKPYRPLPALNVPVAAGWEARLTTDGTGYAFSVRHDRPVWFALFSDR